MSPQVRFGIAVVAGLISCQLMGQTTVPSSRSPNAILAEIETAHRQFKTAVKDPAEIADPQRRAAVAPAAIPPLKTMVADFQELAEIQPQTKRHADQLELQFEGFLAVLGDQPTIVHLATLANSKDLHESLRAQASQFLARWVVAGKDQEAQAKLTDELQTLDQAHPEDEDLTFITVTLSQSSKSEALQRRLLTLATDMRNAVADKVRAATTRP